MITLLVEPGSNTSVTGRLFSVAVARRAPGSVSRGAVDGRHREHVTGLHVDDDRHAALRVHRVTPCEQRLLGLPLERLVEGEHEVLPRFAGDDLALAARDVVALRVALRPHLAGRALSVVS